jgi:hypothetical protein
MLIMINTCIINKHAYASQLNSFTHPTALLVLHDRGILAHTTSITGHSLFLEQLKSIIYSVYFS